MPGRREGVRHEVNDRHTTLEEGDMVVDETSTVEEVIAVEDGGWLASRDEREEE